MENPVKASDMTAMPQGKPKKKHRPSVALGLWIIKRVEKIIRRYSRVPTTPFLDPAIPPFNSWIPQLEAKQDIIRKELEQVLQHKERIPNFQDISKDQTNLTTDNLWKTFFLYGYGYKIEKNCAQCPETAKIAESIPGMFTAFFSIVEPGKHIPMHRGPYKGLLRVHLPLIVPEPREKCRIEVGGETHHWEPGKCMVFDDTYRHQVWNETDGIRVVLFLDIHRPLAWPGSWVNSLILKLICWSPFIQDARKNQQAWEKALDEE